MHVDGRRVNNQSFAWALKAAGYSTALFGKYLNRWPMKTYLSQGFDAFLGNTGSSCALLAPSAHTAPCGMLADRDAFPELRIELCARRHGPDVCGQRHGVAQQRGVAVPAPCWLQRMWRQRRWGRAWGWLLADPRGDILNGPHR